MRRSSNVCLVTVSTRLSRDDGNSDNPTGDGDRSGLAVPERRFVNLVISTGEDRGFGREGGSEGLPVVKTVSHLTG